MNIKIKGCSDCPFRLTEYNEMQGELHFCIARQYNEGLAPEIEKFNPEWCPLREDSITIEVL